MKGNLLNAALKAIGSDSFVWMRYAGRSTNSAGFDAVTYDAPVQLRGSVQAVPRSAFASQGLDFTKEYKNFFVSSALSDVTRASAGDILEYNGKRLQCISKTDWMPHNGWVQMLAVEVGDA